MRNLLLSMLYVMVMSRNVVMFVTLALDILVGQDALLLELYMSPFHIAFGHLVLASLPTWRVFPQRSIWRWWRHLSPRYFKLVVDGSA